MARIFLESFEAQDYLRFYYSSNLSLTTGITGMDGYCLSITTQTCALAAALPSAQADLYFARKLRLYGLNTNSIMQFGSGLTLLGTCYVGADGLIRCTRGTTVVATGTTSLVLNKTYCIEGYYYPLTTSSGRWQIWIDGNLEIDYTGQSSNNALTIDRFGIGYQGGGFMTGHFAYQYVDDIIIDDANQVGVTRIAARVPNADDGTPEWTKSGGTYNYENVDERPYSDTDYNYINANDKLDLFGAASLGLGAESIKCVQIRAVTNKVGTPTPTKIKPVVKSSTTTSEGTAQTVGLEPALIGGIWETDPNTSAAWTESGVDASKFGYKSAA